MGVDEKLLKAAYKLVVAANKEVDKRLPGQLANIVKTHAMAGVAASWIPVPGAGLAAGIAAVWGMYYRINHELQMPFGENVTKSVASGIGTNLAAYLGILGVGEVVKFIPGLGSLVGAVVMSAASYALTLASGYVYMNVLSMLLSEKGAENITESDWKTAVSQVMSDKADVQSFVREAKSSYKR